jgi:FkbM family methyltransferase
MISAYLNKVLLKLSPSFLHSTQMLVFYKEVFIRQEYRFLVKKTRPNTVVVDIGAAFGETAIYFAQYDSISCVYAYEPYPQVFQYAKAYISTSALRRKIRLILAAVGRRDGKLAVSGTCTDLQAARQERNRGVSVDVCSLSSILEGKKNVVLKCDCEGQEYEIFDCVNSDIMKEVYRVQIEFHDGVGNLAGRLSACGFVVHVRNKVVENGKRIGYVYAYKR